MITSINGIQVNTNEEVAAIIEKSGGVPLSLSVLRSNMSFEVQITPVKADDGISYKAGLWVRDSSAGIGTLTFTTLRSTPLPDWAMESATLTQAT